MTGTIALLRFLALGVAFFLVVDRQGRPRPGVGRRLQARPAR